MTSSVTPGIVWHMPIIDPKRRSQGMRWTVQDHRPLWETGMPGLEAGDMLVSAPEAAARAWVQRPDVPANVVIEVPASRTVDPWWNDWVLHRTNPSVRIALNGRPQNGLPEHWLARLSYVIVPWKDDRRRHANDDAHTITRPRRIPSLSSEVDNWYDAEKSFAIGCAAVIGWPWGVTAQALTMNASEQTIMLLLQQIQEDVNTEVLQRTLKQDPSIALKLMRYLASPLIGMGIQMQSIQQALNFLGRDRFRRWLVLLMVNASKDVNQHPHRHRAMRRGWMMEKIGRRIAPANADAMFMVGAFSMVDRLWGWGENDLRHNTAVPGEVVDAIFKLSGTYGMALRLVEAMEGSSTPEDWSPLAQALGLSVQDVHRDFCDTVDDMALLLRSVD